VAEEPLTAQIAVRLTQREYQLISDRAGKESRAVSAVARMLIRDALGLKDSDAPGAPSPSAMPLNQAVLMEFLVKAFESPEVQEGIRATVAAEVAAELAKLR